jgi:phage replication initiation protein
MEDLGQKMTVPPYTNRGVQNTEETHLTSTVDWFQGTFVLEKNVQEIIYILGFDNRHVFMPSGGKFGYKNSVRFGNITILYNGTEKMGVHVEMTGQGCRTFEKHSELDWRELFLRFEVHPQAKIKMTRIDLAIDDFKGYFKIPNLRKYLLNSQVTSLFRMAKNISNIVIKTGEEKGHTLYFGRPTSEIQVRFYEKNIEQEMKGNTVPEHAQIWNRTEIQARDGRAEAFAYLIAHNTFDLGYIITGTLKNYISFRREGYVKGKKSNDTNKSRWDIAPFWLKFLGDCEKLKLTMKVKDETIERKHKWVNHSVKKSLAMLAVAFQEDSSEMINQLIEEGHAMFTEYDYETIQTFRDKGMNFQEYQDQINGKTKKPLFNEEKGQLVTN